MRCNSKKLLIKTNLFLEHLWYKKNFFCYLLLPFSAIYFLVALLHRALYRFGLKKTYHFNVPIIVVGNITVGGTGKTPLVMWLAEFLSQNKFKPGIVSRGYKPCLNKGETKINYPYLVKKTDSPKSVGDEALLIAQRSGCPLVIAKNRVAAVKKLLALTDCDIIISDDGLQHHALGRNFEIVVIDDSRKFGNSFLLPAGPLRESKKRLKKVDSIIVTELAPNYFYFLKNPAVQKSIKNFSGESVHAVAGIGNPQKFFHTLKKLGITVIEHPFPDHYWFTEKDLEFGDEKAIIMTEKDAVKCLNFAPENSWALRVEAKVDDKLKLDLLNRIGKHD